MSRRIFFGVGAASIVLAALAGACSSFQSADTGTDAGGVEDATLAPVRDAQQTILPIDDAGMPTPTTCSIDGGAPTNTIWSSDFTVSGCDGFHVDGNPSYATTESVQLDDGCGYACKVCLLPNPADAGSFSVVENLTFAETYPSGTSFDFEVWTRNGQGGVGDGGVGAFAAFGIDAIFSATAPHVQGNGGLGLKWVPVSTGLQPVSGDVSSASIWLNFGNLSPGCFYLTDARITYTPGN